MAVMASSFSRRDEEERGKRVGVVGKNKEKWQKMMVLFNVLVSCCPRKGR